MGLMLAYFYSSDVNASKYAYYGILGLRHRGTSVSYAVLAGGDIVVGNADPWRDFELPKGHAVLAAVGPQARMARVSSNGVKAVVAVDGACPVEAALRAAAKTPREAADELSSREELAACAVAILRSDGWYIVSRGSTGVRPLSMGGYGFDAVYYATETAPVSLMGGRYSYDLEPGEALYGNSYVLERVRHGGRRGTCLFEYVYLARPDSYVDGVNVYLFRREMGRRLARDHGATVDVVVGVPETAIPYAVGYAEEAGASFEPILVSTVGRVRTALLEAGPRERSMILSLKLNPVPDILEGKSVAIVDDSVVTGLTLKTVVQRLRRSHGVREVHVAVSSPKLVSVCPHGVQRLKEEHLVAKLFDDETIARILDADTVAWLNPKHALLYLQAHGIRPCTACMGV